MLCSFAALWFIIFIEAACIVYRIVYFPNEHHKAIHSEYGLRIFELQRIRILTSAAKKRSLSKLNFAHRETQCALINFLNDSLPLPKTLNFYYGARHFYSQWKSLHFLHHCILWTIQASAFHSVKLIQIFFTSTAQLCPTWTIFIFKDGNLWKVFVSVVLLCNGYCQRLESLRDIWIYGREISIYRVSAP